MSTHFSPLHSKEKVKDSEGFGAERDRNSLTPEWATSLRQCLLYSPGIVAYNQAWEWQRSLVAERKANPDLNDVLLLLQHPPVYTLGQGSDPKFLNFDPAESVREVVRIERGGEVTYHAPGQVVGYPILNLNFYQKDLHWYLRQLEEVLICTLAEFGLQGTRVPGLTGVWIDGCKVAAIGIKVSRWITMHGFSLNVSPDLQGFAAIVPCGIPDKPVGSLEQFVPGIDLETVQHQVAIAFAHVFNVQMISAYDGQSLVTGHSSVANDQ